MKTKSQIHSGGNQPTAKQWAWQFLRRNKTYQEAFAVMSSLNFDQKGFLQALTDGLLFEVDSYLKIIETLPTKIFDQGLFRGANGRHPTLKSYLEDLGAYSVAFRREWGGVAEHLELILLEKYRLYSYVLKDWIDPKTEQLSNEQEQIFGYLEPPLQHALLPLQSIGSIVKMTDAFQQRALPDQLKVIGNKDLHFYNFRLARKLQTTLAKFSGRESLAKKDPTQNDSITLTDVTFDLSLPLHAQIPAITKALEDHQKLLLRAGLVQKLPSRSNRGNVFPDYLAILDLDEQGFTDLEIAKKLKKLNDETYTDAQGQVNKSFFDPKKPKRSSPQEHTEDIRKQLERARILRDHGYRSLALQPD
jgi:hypothetical protein